MDVLLTVLADLTAEAAWLDTLLTALDDPVSRVGGADGAWGTPTPAAGWTIAHQVAHLAWSEPRG